MTSGTEKTKSLLLSAGLEEFAQYGIAGARVNRIAERAGVNKERIYGHFGSKEGLFHAVLEEAMRELAHSVRPGEGEVGAYVGRVFDYHRENPRLLRLLMFEALHYGDRLAVENPDRYKWYTGVSRSLAEATGHSQDDAGRLLLTLIGLAAWPLAMPQLFRLALDAEPSSAEAGDGLRDFLVRFADRATVANPPADGC